MLSHTLTVACILLASATAAPTVDEKQAAESSQLLSRSVPIERVRRGSAIGSVAASWHPLRWTIPVQVQGKTFNVLLDTGSAELTLPSIGLNKTQINGNPVYDPSKAETGSLGTYKNDIGGGAGIVVKDCVTIGGLSVSMAIDAATSSTEPGPFTGTIGMAFQGTRNPEFMEVLQPQLPLPVFTMKLTDSDNGVLGFGSIDPKYHLTTLSVNNASDFGIGTGWEVPVLTFPVANNTQKSVIVLFDTGAPTTALDPAIVTNYFSKVKNARSPDGTNWHVPCSAGPTLPDLTFTDPDNPGFTHRILGPKFLSTPVSPAEKDAEGEQMCYTLLICDTFNSIGVPFFMSHYVVFNQAVPSISIALQ